MSENTRIEIWDKIREAQIIGADTVILPISQVNLLLECARLVNQGATLDRIDIRQKMRDSFSWENIVPYRDFQNHCVLLSAKL